MMKKLLFVVSEGIGNQLQTMPAFLKCKDVYGCKIAVYNTIPNSYNATYAIFGNHAEVLVKDKDGINVNDFFGQVIMFPMIHSVPKIKVLNKYFSKINRFSLPEVEENLLAVTGTKDDKWLYECGKLFDHIKRVENTPQVILHNGYSKVSKVSASRWRVKSYAHYGALAKILSNNGVSVGSIGSKDEYVQNTINLTGRNLSDSISIIKGSNLVISNDTFSYHLANILGIKNIVIFTCTDLQKNYSKKFHKFSTIMRREDLKCSPCQNKHKEAYFWLDNREVCNWECRNIDVGLIFNKVKEML
jgi:hypothetical protein